MQDRISRFDTRPGAMKPPSPTLYPSKPVQPMARWLVRMVVEVAEGETCRGSWKHDAHVWAFSSIDAVGRARIEFYGSWATQADRERLPLRVIEVFQVAI